MYLKAALSAAISLISDGNVKARLVKMFDPYCTEMEGAAIAQAAWLNQIPFVIIRAISDKADGSAQMDYSELRQSNRAYSETGGSSSGQACLEQWQIRHRI